MEVAGVGRSEAHTGVKISDEKSRWSIVRSRLSRIVKVEQE